MKRFFKNAIYVTTSLVLITPSQLKAQDKVEASVGADIVSSYIWRGENLGGMSVQPSLSLEYKGLSLEAWGSAGLQKDDEKELDQQRFLLPPAESSIPYIHRTHF